MTLLYLTGYFIILFFLGSFLLPFKKCVWSSESWVSLSPPSMSSSKQSHQFPWLSLPPLCPWPPALILQPCSSPELSRCASLTASWIFHMHIDFNLPGTEFTKMQKNTPFSLFFSWQMVPLIIQLLKPETKIPVLTSLSSLFPNQYQGCQLYFWNIY